jgi:hypothetical protein
MSNVDAIHYLFYTTNQIADFFPSGVDNSVPISDLHYYTIQSTFQIGNNNLPNGTNSEIDNVYNAFNNNPPTNLNTQAIANVTFNFAIRSVATLFNWFQYNLQSIKQTAYLQNCYTSNSSSIDALANNQPGNIFKTDIKFKALGISDIFAGNNVSSAYSTGDFVVQNGSKAGFYAGNSIHLTDGFKVENGAEFIAKITPFPCGVPPLVRVGSFNSNNKATLIPSENMDKVETPKLLLFPNPFSQNTILQFTNTANEEFTLDVFDITGRVVFTMPKITGTQYTFNRNNLAEGIYLLKLKSNTKSYTERLVVQN